MNILFILALVIVLSSFFTNSNILLSLGIAVFFTAVYFSIGVEEFRPEFEKVSLGYIEDLVASS